MTNELTCKNCNHSKEHHKLVLDYPDGEKVYPETITPFAPIASKIICTKCSCEEYESKEDVEQ